MPETEYSRLPLEAGGVGVGRRVEGAGREGSRSGKEGTGAGSWPPRKVDRARLGWAGGGGLGPQSKREVGAGSAPRLGD